MEVDLSDHHRRSVRLKGYDYSQAGAYFITIVTWQRLMLFGRWMTKTPLNDTTPGLPGVVFFV